jgi:hypothetical protein
VTVVLLTTVFVLVFVCLMVCCSVLVTVCVFVLYLVTVSVSVVVAVLVTVRVPVARASRGLATTDEARALKMSPLAIREYFIVANAWMQSIAGDGEEVCMLLTYSLYTCESFECSHHLSLPLYRNTAKRYPQLTDVQCVAEGLEVLYRRRYSWFGYCFHVR